MEKLKPENRKSIFYHTFYHYFLFVYKIFLNKQYFPLKNLKPENRKSLFYYNFSMLFCLFCRIYRLESVAHASFNRNAQTFDSS